jgi:hypothetical protein
VLEVRDPRYATAFGTGVAEIEIVDIDPRNDDATIVADLADVGSLPVARYDCAIVPQTLVYVADPVAAVTNLWQSLVPGGTLLLTVPMIARVDPDAPGVDRWHLPPAGLREVIARGAPDAADVDVAGHGNVLAAISFLHGLGSEELRQNELEAHDDRFPIVVTAVARKAG